MNITTSPAFDIAAARLVAKINAARPKDEEGEFIGLPMAVQEFVTASLEALGKSWGDAQADDDMLALKPIGAAFLAASPDKQAQIQAILA